MAISTDQKNEIKQMVLFELERMFTGITNKYNTKENHDMMLFLLDIESAIKQRLAEVITQGESDSK